MDASTRRNTSFSRTSSQWNSLKRAFRSSLTLRSSVLVDDRNILDRLPSELQSHVFLHGQAMQDRQAVIDGQIPFELLVSHVCKRWRTSALNTPLLWAKLTIRVHDTWLEMLNQYLARSQDCDLDILIDFPDLGSNHPATFLKDVTAFLAAIVNHSGRWQQLEVWSAYSSNLQTILEGLRQRKAWQLRSLVFVLKDADDGQETESRANADIDFSLLPEHVPNLTHMHMYDMTGPVLAIVPTVTCLTLETAYSRHFFPSKLLSVLPLLTELCICNYVTYGAARGREFEDDLEILGPVVIPSLTRLRVEGLRNPIKLGHLLQVLDTPNLQYLRLENINEERSEGQCLAYQFALAEALQNSFRRTKKPRYPVLRTFEFHCGGCTTWFENFIEIIPGIDHISVGRLDRRRNAMVTVNMLSIEDGIRNTHQLLPKLERLAFYDMDCNVAFPQFLVALMKDRRDPPRIIGREELDWIPV